ncbi:MAG: hypothetical protein ABIS30_05455 [Gallionella sp.]
MIRLLLACFLIFLSIQSRAADYSSFASASDNFDATATKLIAANAKNESVSVWLGKVLDVSIYKNKDGITVIEWFCEQHLFEFEPKLPLTEPFIVKTDTTGNFVVSLNMPTLTVR